LAKTLTFLRNYYVIIIVIHKRGHSAGEPLIRTNLWVIIWVYQHQKLTEKPSKPSEDQIEIEIGVRYSEVLEQYCEDEPHFRQGLVFEKQINY